MRTVLIFANPIAGRGRGKRIAVRLRDRLDVDGYDVRIIFDRADTLPDDALPLEDVRAAISIGGDGTLRAVAQRLFDRYPADNIPPLMVVPLGTANLMALHLAGGRVVDGAEDADRVAQTVDAQQIVHLDAARANGRLFLLMAGAGIDAEIVHALDRMRSGPIDLTSYAMPAALAFQKYIYSPLAVEIDGMLAFEPAPALVFVGNIAEYGTGFPILVDARSDDGVLDVCVLPCRSPFDLVKIAMLTINGDHLREPGVVYRKAKRVRITCPTNDEVPVQVDGEAFAHTPLEIEMMETRIPFLIAR